MPQLLPLLETHLKWTAEAARVKLLHLLIEWDIAHGGDEAGEHLALTCACGRVKQSVARASCADLDPGRVTDATAPLSGFLVSTHTASSTNDQAMPTSRTWPVTKTHRYTTVLLRGQTTTPASLLSIRSVSRGCQYL